MSGRGVVPPLPLFSACLEALSRTEELVNGTTTRAHYRYALAVVRSSVVSRCELPLNAHGIAQNPRAVVTWQTLPIALRSPIGQPLAVVRRSPSMRAEKTRRIVPAKPNDRICAVDLLQERRGRKRQELLRPRRLVTEDRQRRARASGQTCAGALARCIRGVLAAGLRLVASKILATASHGRPCHSVQAD